MTRQLVEDLLKYKRIDGVQSCLETLIDRFTDGVDQAVVFRSTLEERNIPSLVIWGEEDRILPAEHARNLSNQSNVHILPGGGHMIQMESASEVNRLITDFWQD